jgi:hypothetical protein
LKAYLYRLNIIATDKCNCGGKEIAKHLLLDYRNYRKERESLQKRIRKEIKFRRLNLPILLHIQIGIKNILVFLKETNICTKNWHMNRGRLEERRIDSGAAGERA